MKIIRFIGKVLPDGHLSLPESVAKEKNRIYEVILIPIEGLSIYEYAESLAREKGFTSYSPKDIEKIIHESRGIKE